jgi:hypothetical protein
MRWAAVALAVGIVSGCEAKQSSPPKETKSAESTPVVQVPSEPVTDNEPPRFDPVNGNRTLRWIANVSVPYRQPDPNRVKAAEQSKAVQKALSGCLKQTVKWKVPLEKIGVDGTVWFLPFRTTAFPDRSEFHPEMTLRIRPWNFTGTDSVLMSPAYLWLSTLRAGQDTVTVQGRITEIYFRGQYDWYVSLSEVQLTPDAITSLRAETQLFERLEPDDADKSFAWLKNQTFLTLDPCLTRDDRKRRQNDLASQFRSLAGTKIHWRWPTAVAGNGSLMVEDVVVVDYPQQLSVRTGLLLKQPKQSGKAGQPRLANLVGYGRAFPESAAIGAEALAKIRVSKKSTLRGKIARIDHKTDGLYPPRYVEIAVSLDEVSIEP